MGQAAPQNVTKNPSDELYKFNLRERILENLYLNPTLSDVRFLFPKLVEGDAPTAKGKNVKKEYIEIPAHKFILSAASEVFNTMFYGPLQEKGDVEITDSSPEAFKEFLQCFYLGSGKFSKENIDRVMYLANKYMINDCLTVCSKFLIDFLTVDDVCSGYALSILYKQTDLKIFCKEKIKSNAEAVFDSEDFLDCSRDTLAQILKLELDCKEATVFDGCMKWAKNACKKNGLNENNTDNIRAQLRECLYLIPFSRMTLEELCQCTSKYDDLLRGDECMDVMNCIGSKGYKSKKFIQRVPLCWGENQIWECKTRSSDSLKILGETDSVQITSSKTTLLGALYIESLLCYDSCNFPYSASIEVIDKSSASELFSKTVDFEDCSTVRLEFPTPITIKEDIKYEIRLKFKKNIGQPVSPVYGGTVASPNGLEINFEAEKNIHLISCLQLIDV